MAENWVWQSGKVQGPFGKSVGPRFEFCANEEKLNITFDMDTRYASMPKAKAIKLAVWILDQFGYDVEFQDKYCRTLRDVRKEDF